MSDDAFQRFNTNQMLNANNGGGDAEGWAPLGFFLKGTRGILDNVQGFWDKIITTVSGIWGNGREKIPAFFMNLHAQLKQISDSSHPQQHVMFNSQPSMPSNIGPIEQPHHGLPDNIGAPRSFVESIGR